MYTQLHTLLTLTCTHVWTHSYMHTWGCGPLVVYPVMEGLLGPIPGCSPWLTLGFGSYAYRPSASMVASRGLRQSHLSTLLAEMFIEVELGVIRRCSFFLHLSQLDA